MMHTSCEETPLTLVKFAFSTKVAAGDLANDKFRYHLHVAILGGRCPDFVCSMGAPYGTAYVALWKPEHAVAVRAWARSVGVHVTELPPATSQGAEIGLPDIGDIGDIAPGGVVGPCIAEIESMLRDQRLEPTALNWIAVCDHFLSQSLISPERALAFRLLRGAIERAALAAVTIRVPVLHEEKPE